MNDVIGRVARIGDGLAAAVLVLAVSVAGAAAALVETGGAGGLADVLGALSRLP